MRIPIILATVLLSISFLIDAYIYYDIRSICKKRLWSKFYGISAICCWAVIITTICMPIRSEQGDIAPVMWILYCYLSLYLAKFVYLIFSVIGRLIGRIFKSRKAGKVARITGTVACAGILIVMATGVCYTRYHIQVNRVDFASTKVPESFDGYTIAQISDLHVGTWGNDTTFVSNLVDSVNSLRPDLIVFTGDIVNRMTPELEPFLHVLSRLNAKDGVLSILGNHDYGDYVDWKNPNDREANNTLLAAYEQQMGWNLLNNRRIFINNATDSIMIIGVENWGDPPFPVYGNLNKALPESADSIHHQNDKNFKILLTHNPEHWNREVSHTTNIDLSLAGHTHAMQMMMAVGGWKWSPARYRYTQWGGMYERPNNNGETSRLYVNIGAGEVGMPSRLLAAYPEITLFTLKKN